ncbi:hypothetical protein TIFTF001_004386 [Ficus carica]|uniref:Uncharacterized protein n=1 Tax=Ficus carica TaxID=3494 RepID=A0AA88CVW3_FICCA|nr:hypothetical protein TIFTF001_004386 [Ficus carica]
MAKDDLLGMKIAPSLPSTAGEVTVAINLSIVPATAILADITIGHRSHESRSKIAIFLVGFATSTEAYCELKLEIRAKRLRFSALRGRDSCLCVVATLTVAWPQLSPSRGRVAIAWSRSVSPMAPSRDPVAEVPQAPELSRV